MVFAIWAYLDVVLKSNISFERTVSDSNSERKNFHKMLENIFLFKNNSQVVLYNFSLRNCYIKLQKTYVKYMLNIC